MNGKFLLDEMVKLGLSQYEANSLLSKANRQGWSLQRAYFDANSRIFITDIILITYLVSFISYLAVHDPKDALIAFFIFGMLIAVIEFAARFHRGYVKKIRTLLRLKKLSVFIKTS